MHLALRVIRSSGACAALTVATLAAGALPAGAAGGTPALVNVTAASATAATWPSLRPRCPERAPVGAVFLRRVQPPLGYGYDLYSYRGKLLHIFC